MCFSNLPPREQQTFLAIVRATREPRYILGVPALALPPYLHMPDTLDRLESFLINLKARQVVVLAPDDRRALAELAARVENEHRASAVQRTAQKILLSFADEKPLRKSAAHGLYSELRETTLNQIEKRVSDLRTELEKCAGPCHPPQTVTHSPYRVVTADGSQVFMVVAHLDEIWFMVQRPAWLDPIGYRETLGLKIAQQCFRRAVRTGVRTNDDGRRAGRCTPLHDIPDATIRANLRRALELSDHFEKVLASFYELDRDSGYYFMHHAAAPYAADAVEFLTVSRNRALCILNDLFVPAGFEPLPLVTTYGSFPKHMPVPVPIAETLTEARDEALDERFRALDALGLELCYQARQRRRRQIDRRDFEPPAYGGEAAGD